MEEMPSYPFVSVIVPDAPSLTVLPVIRCRIVGVVGFTESLAEEVRQHDIRVSVICPGSTDTRFSPSETSGRSRERMLRSEDIAHAVRAIVTQEPNSFISEIILRPTRKP